MNQNGAQAINLGNEFSHVNYLNEIYRLNLTRKRNKCNLIISVLVIKRTRK